MISEKHRHSLYFLAYVLLTILILNSSYLSYKYIKFYYGGMNLESFDCADDCDSVMMSEYSMLWGIPVPVYGLVYFLAITVFFTLLTNYKTDRHNWMSKLSTTLIAPDHYRLQQRLFEVLLIAGCLAALSFLYILYFVLHMVCKFCVLSHSGLLLFTLIYFLMLKRFAFKFEE